ncbi:hypothetical protein COK34_06925 [Bacillus thuringiensis]|uniref:hypothetical protein n=1 Tax=Bacillus thuringiensis TaxID=1428 RepID=UPI000BF8ED0F|nr:hypothetical protein [Bacillus thuringiensis]PFD66887.1 hypothetical protein CN309_08445 [Bacillus thuringiensis]PFO46544.1 hypothetical protein COJ84_01390 [Bacillus thuringiensis]PFR56342.1 hypothetical protein COK34_06925 [Bacillus thuringiensis]
MLGENVNSIDDNETKTTVTTNTRNIDASIPKTLDESKELAKRNLQDEVIDMLYDDSREKKVIILFKDDVWYKKSNLLKEVDTMALGSIINSNFEKAGIIPKGEKITIIVTDSQGREFVYINAADKGSWIITINWGSKSISL